MIKSKETSFADRLSTAASAKKAAVERFRAKSLTNDPALAERLAAGQAISIARDARAAERKAARLASDAAAKAARAAALEIEQAARATEIETQAARDAALQAERKEARDARYAARKAWDPLESTCRHASLSIL